MSQSPKDRQSQHRLRALSAGLMDRGLTVLHQGVDRKFDLAEGLSELWPDRHVVGRVETEVMPASVASLFADSFDRCRREAAPQRFDFELTDGARRQQFDARMQPDEDGVLTTIANVTEERARDAAMASLLREVSHRSKNLLAIVQSVAMQTAVHSGNIQDFLDKFRGRLHALSGTQDLVTESDWRGTYLQSLITAQLTRVGQLSLANMRVTGENPLLGPNASLHVGLAIHELASNAVLHGALSKGKSGQVWIDSSFAQVPGHLPDLIIEWRESGIDTGGRPQPARFGTLVLDRIVPLSVGGSADYAIGPDTVSYRLRVPADQYEA